MKPILNEMSLEGQYSDIDEFVESGFKQILKFLKLLEKFDFELLKKADLWQRKATSTQTLHDILKIRHFSAGQRFKSLLSKMIHNPPYWDSQTMQKIGDRYLCNNVDVAGTSIAEACERDEHLVSFTGSTFSSRQIKVTKNNDRIFNLQNFVEATCFLDWLYDSGKICFKQFVVRKFDGSRLDFSRVHPQYNFDTLHSSEYQNFLDSFSLFASLDWGEIYNHPGLQYREFHDRRFSSNASGKTCKFNVSAKLRCHGFREDERFIVLAFERDHKLSDKG